MNTRLFGEVLVTMLVIVDPPGMIPIFLALTGPLAARDRNRAAWQAVALALGVIVVFAVAEAAGQAAGEAVETKFGFATFLIALGCVFLVARWLREPSSTEPLPPDTKASSSDPASSASQP